MVIFTQKINGVTGCLEWDVKDDNYDYHQEIARSAFADMLHDTERNQKYFSALQAAIHKMHAEGKLANVLDIGTGTGLLSIMAAQCGADSIVACEAFQPMSDCAVKIIQENGFANKITVIPKRSTELVVGENGDMKYKANILVTEVFDTELIGEGAIQTFSHAHNKLLEDDCIVVPDSATIYAQVVECPSLQKWNKLLDLADEDGDIIIQTPKEVKKCNGSAAVHDVQLSQVPPRHFKEILKPIPVLEYDWSGKNPLKKNVSTIRQDKSLITGKAQMVFMWWDLKMDTDGKILLSCAPWWHHPDAKADSEYPQDTVPWRDHWMQAIYYFPEEISVNKDDKLTLISSQDEYSLWFNLQNGAYTSVTAENSKRPICECGIHMSYSRTHVACMNDGTRNKKMLQVLKENINIETICLCLNGSSLMGLAAAKMGAKKVVYIEPGIINKRILNNYISFNKLENVLILPDLETLFQTHLNENISLLIGDPNFNKVVLPWDNLYVAHIVEKFKDKFKKNMNIIPRRCTLWTMTVEFLDLHKIKAPLNICENINLQQFDNLIKDSRSRSDDEIEPQPLWEYPCLCRSKPVQILEIDLKNTEQIIVSSGSAPCEVSGAYNGFAFWLDWNIGDKQENKITTGPLVETVINERVTWDPYTRQGVKILEENKMQNVGDALKYEVKCNLNSGLIDINVSIN